MSKTAEINYEGNLRTQVTHSKSGQSFYTDAPTDNNGKGEAISPTDMVAAAAVSCMMTMMGIVAERSEIEMGEVKGEVEKVMGSGPRRIIALSIVLIFSDHNLSDAQKALLENTALGCPVTRSLHPDIAVNVKFVYEA